jgi:hypothetical protein
MEGKMGISMTFSTMDNLIQILTSHLMVMLMLINKHHVIIYEVQNMEETYLKHNKINAIFLGSI